MSRQKKTKKSPLPPTDPFHEREAQKYAKPIPSREYILMRLEEVGKPLNLQKIAELLQLSQEEELEALRRRLKAMERDGQLIRNRSKGYGIAQKMDLIRGRVIAHPDGFGFLVPDQGGEDLYLSERQMRSIMHGDRILVNIIGLDYKGRREAALVEVLERANKEIIGRFFTRQGVAFVEPDNRRLNKRILINQENLPLAENGQIVVVELIQYPTKNELAIGKITEVMGEHRGPGMEIDIAIRSHALPHQWPEAVLQEAEQIPLSLPDNILQHREDMRAIPFVTIDGEDAKDFDDAVYCEPRGKGWLLKVAIADVASYVKPETAIDEEAKKRGNSVYFPEKVIPMLPEVLSNGLCSLKPQVDRLCLVCELAIDMYGRNRRTRFFRAVIRSAARLTYTEVAAALEGEVEAFPDANLLPQIHNLYALYQLLLKRRQKRGAIDFDTVESKFIFDKNRKIQQIVPVKRNDAHKLIEEMMLAANVATAEWLQKQQMPLIYRVHEGPNNDKLSELKRFLNELGLRILPRKGHQPTVKDYARLVEKIANRPDARLIQTVLLRSLKMAIYTPENRGHFGLAFESYTHFTSPIRRYTDLMIHRAIHHCLANRSPDEFPYSNNTLALLAENCSMTERRAEEATRNAIAWLKCEYMQDKIGEVYDGLITGVTPFGLFVELDEILIEGLVHVTALGGEYFHFDMTGHRLIGEFSQTVYRLSDRLRVRVIRVDLEDRKIDFDLA